MEKNGSLVKDQTISVFSREGSSMKLGSFSIANFARKKKKEKPHESSYIYFITFIHSVFLIWLVTSKVQRKDMFHPINQKYEAKFPESGGKGKFCSNLKIKVF